MEIKAPNRVSHTYTQQLVAAPEVVFPLLCPVREADWADGWDPITVATHSGAAELDCVFVTPGAKNTAIWYITKHESDRGFVEMLKITPEFTACKLTIQLRATPKGSEADVTYMHTSLGPDGDAFIASFTEAFYCEFMKDWEKRLNFFLTHGRCLKTEEK